MSKSHEGMNGTDIAQTIMRPLVQNTLNAFHNTGNLVSGFQRYLDIVELSNDGNCIIECKHGFNYEKDAEEYKIHPLQLVYRNLFFHVERITSEYPALNLFNKEGENTSTTESREFSKYGIYTIKLKYLYEHRLPLWEFASYFGDLLVALSHEFDGTIVVKRYPEEVYEILNGTYIGIEGIRAVSEISPTKYITLGSNLDELTQYFFNVRTTCIRQVYEVYGLKKAKKVIIKELLDIVGGEYLQEIKYIADKMCWFNPSSKNYELIPITFSGHKKLDKGFIADMAFENSYKVLNQAAKDNSVDDCKSNAARIIFGKY